MTAPCAPVLWLSLNCIKVSFRDSFLDYLHYTADFSFCQDVPEKNRKFTGGSGKACAKRRLLLSHSTPFSKTYKKLLMQISKFEFQSAKYVARREATHTRLIGLTTTGLAARLLSHSTPKASFGNTLSSNLNICPGTVHVLKLQNRLCLFRFVLTRNVLQRECFLSLTPNISVFNIRGGECRHVYYTQFLRNHEIFVELGVQLWYPAYAGKSTMRSSARAVTTVHPACAGKRYLKQRQKTL